MENGLKGRRIALIGGGGFIGHNLAVTLAVRGAQVSVIDSFMVNNFLSLLSQKESNTRDFYIELIDQRLKLLRYSKIPVFVQDARDYSGLSRTLASINPDVVIHLAAVAHANISNKDPFSTFDHSLRTLENALDWARTSPLHRFIYFSSSMVYGNFKTGTVTEETVCEPLGIYGALKIAGEQMMKAYNQVFGLPYTIVRPSALYGPRCISRRVGQIFVENALRGEELTVSGNGSDRLDFTYIKDLVEGIIKVIECDESRNETFNLTYGESRSIAELGDILSRHVPGLTIKYTPKDSLTPSRGTLCIDKAKRLLGFEPKYPIELGMAEYVRWYRDMFETLETKAHVSPIQLELQQ